MSRDWPATLTLAGCGRMGGALLRGWLDGGLPAALVHVVDPHLDDDTVAFCRERGVSLDQPATAPQALVLAVKPQTFAAAPGAFALLARPETLVVSILAGKTLANLRSGLPHAAAIVRAMPNLPAAVGRGASGLAGEAALTPAQRALATTLMTSVGLVEWVEESLIDAVTALSGSGPAYVFLMVEALAAAGAAAGLRLWTRRMSPCASPDPQSRALARCSRPTPVRQWRCARRSPRQVAPPPRRSTSCGHPRGWRR